MKKLNYERYGSLFILILLFIISSIASPYFLQLQNILNILRQVSYTGIIALGMTFVIIGGGIDLSVGSMTALVGGIIILVLNHFGGGIGAIIISILFGLLLGIIGGTINGLLITKGRIAPFIVTLGTMAIFRSLTLYIISAGEFRSKSEIFPSIGMGSFLFIPIPIWIFIGLAIVFHIILNNTRYGRYICAIGSNEKVAQYAAINVDRVRVISYIIVGISVAISSFLLSSRLNSISSSNAGLNFELDAISAVVIGGTSMAGGSGYISGAVFGAILLGIINNMLNMLGVSPYLQGTVKGLLIIGAVLLQRGKR
ncbi:MAG: ribose ABC transporter permease [Candidatus Infernicultor aquiphilus]|uniref:Ribose ABC transporter permease n=1 Tax=Candidatus Infernicultor aquiphilus TaxID=1805029 RepID=A0A1J5GRJ6_9BACT|nr:MAG: ribose ABC transporter permease [Candidatus Atribacteria bacterium CG2_30_33_13]PIW11395.1 MAG: ribose ABC transporter permease [Candidatus Atribacteria bacterium CG17_big_fil_post_rev_8_21_14_2_50_34_11]PIY31710.1 MAG: ribose ABC transporter permease [Candidatus Atribacteria bacterium CG_4_10_14_3_um_filter_34_13]